MSGGTLFLNKVLITTSGIRSRLGSITNYINKSLARVGKKLALAHIIDSYPEGIPNIVTLGHFGRSYSTIIKFNLRRMKF
jgi:hypothetical protein